MTTITITPERIADLIDRAATRIERYGFVQKSMFGAEVYDVGPTGYDVLPTPTWRARCCADGAIQTSAVYDLDGHELTGEPEIPAREAFGSWLVDHRDAEPGEYEVRPWVGAIWKWNDADGRTADEVVTALRECAAGIRAEAGGDR